MRKICLVLLAISLHANDLRISEVMANPQGSEYENEFIEVFNATDHVMQIKGWVLSDGNGVDTISHLSGPIEIEPNGYALILDPGYNIDSGIYTEFLNDTLPIYTISTDGSFGSGGLSNAGESVIIRSLDSLVSSEMTWSSSTQNGYSWERVSVASVDSLSTWQPSLVINGTPGFRNSVTPPQINLGLIGISIEPPAIASLVEITLQIQNLGENTVDAFSVSVYLDENQSGTKNPEEWGVVTQIESPIDAQDIMELPLSLFALFPGVHQLEARIYAENDEFTDDDSIRFEVIGSYAQNSISITEVMFSPSSEQGGEWVEIQNRSEEPISLQGWSFSDANQTRHSISDSLLFVGSNEYLTLCASTNMTNYFGLESDQVLELDSWPALNSSSDSVRLFDANGQGVTSIFYRGSWGESATSLERRHPGTFPNEEINWAASTQADGGTPSRMNTRHLLPVQIQIEEIVVETQTEIGPTQAELLIRFQNLGMDTLYILELESDADIYWQGSLPSFGSDSLTFASSILWPGYNEIPIWIIHEGEVLADTSVQIVLGYPPDQITINEIHYIPHEDQVEFLEFINISSNTIDLKGWQFRDRSGSTGEVLSQISIPPDSLFLWTGDALRLTDWASPFSHISELSTWPSLNNSSDSIIILDPLGHRMLAHGYIAPPNGETGKSLERLALWKPQESESNWSICEDALGITPGRKNSVITPAHNLAVHELRILDSLLWRDESFTIGVSVINAGVDPVVGAQLDIQLLHQGTSIDEQSELLPQLNSGDTLVWEVELISAYSGWMTLNVEIRFISDQMTGDDVLIQQVYISGNSSPLVINEIMPIPLADQNEWIEIYNRSSENVDIGGWFISDKSGSGVSISDSSLWLGADNYLVLGSDQIQNPAGILFQPIPRFPTLNNADELIALIDPQQNPMDEMSYNASTELVMGRSLERIQSRVSGQDTGNWGVCINDVGSTQGTKNSLHYTQLSSVLKIELDPNPFTPNGDGENDELTIHYELPFKQALLSVVIFDMAGRKIAEPFQVKAIAHRGQLSWDGSASYGGKAVTGLYIMKLLFDDQVGEVWSCLKKVYLIR